ncbi:DUF4178 domain-containing protein [Roseimaritima ulvae]|uniref:DUF4178 domain-containing protein n=1 Tax=Roseimaritima ulvae TaxID=980254 RepID=A0A5B9QL55_9BACT|nr:DUF4178 domain-containing protein [Roseimaritima ulvae]QEG39654.1 hypothetical protein UC8_16500 [Roseimaritima ulvae]
MKHRTANCPSCGGPVEFKTASSLVTICDFCQTAVGRADKKIEDYGKVADVGETDTGLRLGLTGTFNKKSFFISGRVRYQHPAGGVWDEWYLAFPGNRWGWLSEAQGKFHLMFERQLSHSIKLPEFDGLQVEETIQLGNAMFLVREKGTATAAAAEGEIPWAFHPGAEHRFADLAGVDGTFATFEYGPPHHAYVGKEVLLADLGIEPEDTYPDVSNLPVAALQLNCPKCAGPLVLRAPDDSERVACPNCSSLLSVEHGKLALFQTLKAQKVVPVIPIGTSGTLEGQKYTVIGFMERFAKYAGNTYPWTEYLLHNQQLGFRWLVCSEGHWSFVEPAAFTGQLRSDRVYFDGDNFRIYDRGTAYVRYVMGEFYWRVSVGEKAKTADYIAPPRMLSFERSKTDKSEESNVSVGRYLFPQEIEQAFGIKNVSRPWGVGPIQPRPKIGASFYLCWILALFLLAVIHLAFSTPLSATGSDPWLLFYGMIFVSLPPAGVLLYLHHFERQRWRDSDFNPYASDD